MVKNDIYFSKEMNECLDILTNAIERIEDQDEKTKAVVAIKYLQETAKKGIEPYSLYEVARGCPNLVRKIQTGSE